VSEEEEEEEEETEAPTPHQAPPSCKSDTYLVALPTDDTNSNVSAFEGSRATTSCARWKTSSAPCSHRG
jgi:hypothetical protein